VNPHGHTGAGVNKSVKLVPTERYGLAKDLESGAILSVDNAKLDAYRLKKAAAERANRTAERLDSVESDVAEIKAMLRELLERTK
jgi:hypothetical protein